MLRVSRPARHEGGLIHQIVVILAVSVLSGVLIAGLALPYVALVTKGADEAANASEGFPLELDMGQLPETTRVVDSKGKPLANFFHEDREYVPLDKISETMQQAIIAIEDERYYQHGAIDIQGTLRALIKNTASDDVIQGGSSITQQLVKMTRLQNAGDNAELRAAVTDDSFARKFKELRYAVWIEDHLTKQQILERYLNIAYFGNGAYGIESAAHRYFSTTAAKLNLNQSALLAGLVKNPSGYNPLRFKDAAKNRRNLVLTSMANLHWIQEPQAEKAKKSPLKLKPDTVRNGCVNTKTPWFCDYLEKYLLEDKSLGKTAEQRERAVYEGGLTIKSTVDVRFQKSADKAVKLRADPTDHAIAAVSMVEPGTGYVRAVAQSRPMGSDKKKGESYLNYVVPKPYGASNGFMSGSTFKVFVLAAAIQDKIPLNTTLNSPKTMNIPLNTFRVCDGMYGSSETWPVSSSTTTGPKNLYTGTRESVNTFYAQLEQMTGVCAPWKLAKKMGVILPTEKEDAELAKTSQATIVPAFTLGFTDATPLEMSEAYATFASRGIHCKATPVLSIKDRDGKVVPSTGPECDRLLKPAEADAVNDILEGVINGGFASAQNLGRDAGGKTGTESRNRAVWFVGYTPNMSTAAVLAGASKVGRPISLVGQVVKGYPMSYDAVSGSQGAAPMWGNAMRGILKWLPTESFHSPNQSVIQGITVPIPYVGGMSTSTAASVLSKAGFRPITGSTVNSTQPAGTVAYTSPSGSGASGQTVLMYISNGQPPPKPDNGGGNGGGPGGGNGGGNGGGPGGGNGGGPGGGNGNFPDFPR